MIVGKDGPQIAALALRPEADSKPPAQPDLPSGDGKVLWASPVLAKALGAPLLGLSGIPGFNNLGLVNSSIAKSSIANSGLGLKGIGGLGLGAAGLGAWSGSARVYPLPAQEGKGSLAVAQGVQFLDDAGLSVDDMLHGIVDQSVQNKHLSATGGKLFKCTIAGAEIVLELTHPSDKGALEKALSISLNSLTILEPIADWVPHLAHAKPYLVGIVEIGGQILAAVRTAAKDTKNIPLGGSCPIVTYPSGQRPKK